MPAEHTTGMAMGRGLLTTGERDYLRGESSKQRMYEARSRLRSRIDDQVSEDVEILDRNQPDLLQELREIVCDGVSDDRAADLQRQLEECREELDEARAAAERSSAGVDAFRIENALDSAQRAAEDIPDGTPGKSSVEDVVGYLEAAIERDGE
jgi:hypothetical protein